MADPEILEFWFDFASPYSYLAAMRIEDLAGAACLTVRWRPFLLGPIFKAIGWDTSPFLIQKEKGAYMWVDMARQCRKYGLDWTPPSVFPRGGVLPSRVALLLDDDGRAAAFCRAAMRQNFAEDRDFGDSSATVAALEEAGLPAEEIVAAAGREETKARLRAQTELARARNIFGAPTFFRGDALFWGNDRLEDAIGWGR
jgi:2-hydroxychromene-2-carboxylate isomerase